MNHISLKKCLDVKVPHCTGRVSTNTSSAVLGWQSQVETEHYSIVYFNCFKYCSAELPLMTGLIHAACESACSHGE